MNGEQVELFDLKTLQTQKKKERRDKGQVRINARDEVLIRWIAEQYAIRLDHLQYLIAMKSENEKRTNPHMVSQRAAIKAVDRWRLLGWVEYRKIIFGADNPGWIWLTAKGLREFGYLYTYREPTISQLKHYYWVNYVRMHFELKHGENIKWVSERYLRREYAEQLAGKSKKDVTAEKVSTHFPDAEILTKSGRAAVEVELTQKSASRENEIVKYLDTRIDREKGVDYYYQVLYYVNESTMAQMKKAIGNRKKFVIRDLKEVELYG